VLVIAGAEDRITPASVVQKVANKYKDVSSYKEFPNHAHWVIGEPGWQEIAEYTLDWLNKALNELGVSNGKKLDQKVNWSSLLLTFVLFFLVTSAYHLPRPQKVWL